jgi:hypothetical protein
MLPLALAGARYARFDAILSLAQHHLKGNIPDKLRANSLRLVIDQLSGGFDREIEREREANAASNGPLNVAARNLIGAPEFVGGGEVTALPGTLVTGEALSHVALVSMLPPVETLEQRLSMIKQIDGALRQTAEVNHVFDGLGDKIHQTTISFNKLAESQQRHERILREEKGKTAVQNLEFTNKEIELAAMAAAQDEQIRAKEMDDKAKLAAQEEQIRVKELDDKAKLATQEEQIRAKELDDKAKSLKLDLDHKEQLLQYERERLAADLALSKERLAAECDMADEKL